MLLRFAHKGALTRALAANASSHTVVVAVEPLPPYAILHCTINSLMSYSQLPV